MGQRKTPVLPVDIAIGAHLKALAAEQGIALRPLAELAGMSHTRVGEAFRGEKALTTGEVDALCAALKTSPLRVLQAVSALTPDPAPEPVVPKRDYYTLAAKSHAVERPDSMDDQ